MIRLTFAVALLLLAAVAWTGPAAVTAGGGCHSDELTDGRGVSVDLSQNCFEPTVIRIDAGQVITWTNQDPDPHTVTGVAESFGDYEELGQGDSVAHTFAEPGVFPYFCVIHPSMVGAVVVGDGEPAGPDDAASVAPSDSGGGDDGGISETGAAIAAVVGLGGAAAGLVGSRMLSARRKGAVA